MKASGGLKFLYRHKSVLGIRERKLLANALLQPRFDYGCNFWYRGITQKLKDKLQVTQNKIIRFILDLHPRSHIDCLYFKKLFLVSVENRVNFMSLNLMYNIFNGCAPNYLDSFHCTSHSHNTRNNVYSFNIPYCKSHSKVGFEYNGIVLWNGLPNLVNYLKNIDDRNVFKLKCKKYFLEKMFHQQNCDFV